MSHEKHTAPTCPPTWLDSAAAFGRECGIDAEFLRILEAFCSANPRTGTAPEPETQFEGDFSELERVTLKKVTSPEFAGELSRKLAVEVDGTQAEMFARRVVAVEKFIAGFD